MAETDQAPMKRTSRDPDLMRENLSEWLRTVLGAESAPEVSQILRPSTNGMSSETLLFDASWSEGGKRQNGSFVARIQPDPDDVPVFPVYDMAAQFEVLRLVGEHSEVPVPRVRWLELDESHVGSRFFVMDRVEGRVPPDMMPYTMESWLLDASPLDRKRLQDATVGVLTKLHAIDPSKMDTSFLELDVPGDTPLRRHVENQRRYYDWIKEGRSFPTLDRAFAWLEEHWPEEGEAVISWGDSRIGNVLYDGFEPAAVLDWEMAALAPREVDIGWMVFLHVFFQDITEKAGLPGLPDFMRRAEVVETYQWLSGHGPRNLNFYEVYAALRHGIVMARVFARQVHFGETEWPDEHESVIYHVDVLREMLGGKFRS